MFWPADQAACEHHAEIDSFAASLLHASDACLCMLTCMVAANSTGFLSLKRCWKN